MTRLLREASLHVVPGSSVVVPVIIEGLPERIEALGEPWERKAEFHVTAISVDKLPADRAEVWRTVIRVCSGRALGPITVRQEVRRVAGHPEKAGLRTLVVMVNVAGLSRLHEDLSAALGARLEPPPAHVTVYSSDPFDGIGIDNQAELAERAPPLSAPEQDEVRAAMDFTHVFGG